MPRVLYIVLMTASLVGPAVARDLDGKLADALFSCSLTDAAFCRSRPQWLYSENLGQCPSIVETVESSPFWDIVFSGKIIEIPRFAVELDLDTGRAISRLGRNCRPSTILWRIARVVIGAINSESASVSWLHISKKTGKVFPAFAHGYSSTAVSLVTRVVWIGASRDDRKPNSDQWMMIGGETQKSPFAETTSIGIADIHVIGDNDRWKGNPLHYWFDSLSSQKGLCCSAYDGQVVEPDDWGTESIAIAGETQFRYWVRINGQKVTVPPEAVVNVPNRAKTAIVWPYSDEQGKTQIRCFLAGPMI